MRVDFLIIGQGLAGSLLAWQLTRHGRRILVIDNGTISASRVAAGLINPVTGRRLYMLPNTQHLLNQAIRQYRRLGEIFGCAFYIERPMHRIIRSQAELRYCYNRLADANYRPCLDRFIDADQSPDTLHAPLGILIQKQTGYLQCELLLQKLRAFFIAMNSYRRCAFSHREIVIREDTVAWGDIEASMIVFCEGYRCIDNPWFKNLPLQPVKGEIIDLRSRAILPEPIINYGYWMIPIAPYLLRTGATYDRDHPDTQVSSTGKQKLLTALQQVCPTIKAEAVTAHRAGVRPCTLDKQPFIGFHPHYRRLAIFNGFGSKGSLQIPGYALSFCETLIHNTPLPKAPDIERYYATHFPR